MQRKPPFAMGGEMGAFEGATEGVMNAVKEATGWAVPLGAAGVPLGVPVPVPEAAAAAGVLEGVPVPLGVSVPVPEAAAAAGVLEGVPVPVADAGAAADVAEADAAAPGAGRLACHSPVHALYSVGQAELPLCWQHVKRGAAALRGLKCTKYVWRVSYMPPTGFQGGESQQLTPAAMGYARASEVAVLAVKPVYL